MKVLLCIGVAATAIAAAYVQPAALWDLYRQLYPAADGERRALNECFTQDPNFNRLDSAARAACYRHNQAAFASNDAAGMGPEARHASAANFIDLWRASGQGRVQQGDIRAVQQNDRFLHSH